MSPDILDAIDAALTLNIGSEVAVRAPSAVEPASERALLPLEPASREPDRVVGYVVTELPRRRVTVVTAVLTVLGAACLILGCLVQVGVVFRSILKPLAIGVAGLVVAKAVAIVLVGVVVACAG